MGYLESEQGGGRRALRMTSEKALEDSHFIPLILPLLEAICWMPWEG